MFSKILGTISSSLKISHHVKKSVYSFEKFIKVYSSKAFSKLDGGLKSVFKATLGFSFSSPLAHNPSAMHAS